MIMRGLYSSLIPPDISCLAGWPSHFLPGLRETETEWSVVHSFFFSAIQMEECRGTGWSNESRRGKKLSGCWTDTSQKDWLLSTRLLHEVMFLGSSLCMSAGPRNSISHSIFRSNAAFHSMCSVGLLYGGLWINAMINILQTNWWEMKRECWFLCFGVVVW